MCFAAAWAPTRMVWTLSGVSGGMWQIAAFSAPANPGTAGSATAKPSKATAARAVQANGRVETRAATRSSPDPS